MLSVSDVKNVQLFFKKCLFTHSFAILLLICFDYFVVWLCCIVLSWCAGQVTVLQPLEPPSLDPQYTTVHKSPSRNRISNVPLFTQIHRVMVDPARLPEFF